MPMSQEEAKAAERTEAQLSLAKGHLRKRLACWVGARCQRTRKEKGDAPCGGGFKSRVSGKAAQGRPPRTEPTGGAAMVSYRVISSDNHVYEPTDLWSSRVVPQFRDRAPYVVRLE